MRESPPELRAHSQQIVVGARSALSHAEQPWEPYDLDHLGPEVVTGILIANRRMGKTPCPEKE